VDGVWDELEKIRPLHDQKDIQQSILSRLADALADSTILTVQKRYLEGMFVPDPTVIVAVLKKQLARDAGVIAALRAAMLQITGGPAQGETIQHEIVRYIMGNGQTTVHAPHPKTVFVQTGLDGSAAFAVARVLATDQAVQAAIQMAGGGGPVFSLVLAPRPKRGPVADAVTTAETLMNAIPADRRLFEVKMLSP
jgi:hypothetical protein